MGLQEIILKSGFHEMGVFIESSPALYREVSVLLNQSAYGHFNLYGDWRC
jgi:hypothetical protein